MLTPDSGSSLVLVIPVTAASYHARCEFCEIAREKLRRLHSEMGALFRDGKISEGEWGSFLQNTFQPRSSAITDAILAQRESVKESIRVLPDDDPAMTAVDLDAVFTAARSERG